MPNQSVSHRALGKPLAGVGFACAALFGVAISAVTPCARADAVAYLLSPLSRFITGQELHVNGGMYMG